MFLFSATLCVLCASALSFSLGIQPMKDSDLTHAIIGAAIEIHRNLGPGLLEAVYEECLAREFTLRTIPFERQKSIPLVYKDLKLECGYRLDFVVAGRIVVELKSIEAIAPIHDSVMLTYLRLSELSLGRLINFNVAVLKDGIRRYVWHYEDKDNAEAQRFAEVPESPKLNSVHSGGIYMANRIPRTIVGTEAHVLFSDVKEARKFAGEAKDRRSVIRVGHVRPVVRRRSAGGVVVVEMDEYNKPE